MKKIFTALMIVIMTGSIGFGQSIFKNELDLPAKGLSQRVTKRQGVNPGKTKVLFEEKGPGCILHWWLTYNPRPGKWAEGQEKDMIHNLRIKFYYDNHEKPDIDLSLGQFFSVLHQRDIYMINNAAIKVVPLNAVNCYFPIPFENCRIELENTSDIGASFWVMFNWQEYPVTEITPYRFNIAHTLAEPADSAGSLLMADVSGEGFIAGISKSLIRKDFTDMWYHSGGDLLFIDGEGSARSIRGIGGEDMFNMSFGVWDLQNDWFGTPIKKNKPYERMMYRIFGPDPIWFYDSFVQRFGTKANDIETIVYYYVDKSKTKSILTIENWELMGPFQSDSYEIFDRKEFPELKKNKWPGTHTADFDPYLNKLNGFSGQPTVFNVPVKVQSEHGWVDITSSFRGRQKANGGAQPARVSAYASGNLSVPEKGTYDLSFGYDDWAKVWINGKLVYQGKNENGFENETISLELPEGGSHVLIKLSNFDNNQWRLWAFNFKVL